MMSLLRSRGSLAGGILGGRGLTGAAVVAMVTIVSPGTSAEAPEFARQGPFPVGVRTVILVDASRDDPYSGHRTLVTDVWYPAAEEARGGRPTRFADFFGAHPEAGDAFTRHFGSPLEDVERRFVTRAVRGAPLRSGRFPLLVFSHGNGGVRHQNCFQMDHLASHGYVVASPDHTGNAGVTVLPERVVPYDREGRGRSASDRPRDVSLVIDRVLAAACDDLAWLRGAVDPEAVGVLGHSFGGFTCLQVAGSDRRVKAILPMTFVSPAPSSVPMLLMLGGLDRTVGEPGNMLGRAHWISAPPPKYLLVLRRGGHFSFSEMDAINPRFGDGIGNETRRGQTVEYLGSGPTKEIINAYTLAFFERHLRGDAKAGEFLQRNAYPEQVDLRAEPR